MNFHQEDLLGFTRIVPRAECYCSVVIETNRLRLNGVLGYRLSELSISGHLECLQNDWLRYSQ